MAVSVASLLEEQAAVVAGEGPARSVRPHVVLDIAQLVEDLVAGEAVVDAHKAPGVLAANPLGAVAATLVKCTTGWRCTEVDRTILLINSRLVD